MTKKERVRRAIRRGILIAAVLLVLGTVAYIMIHQIGLVDGLDFGAGAYYYADIPNFQQYISGDHYDAQVPMWGIIALFLLWGALMYRLWVWIEKHGGSDQ